eukprot:6503847-Prymnesium_polylepis.1
MSVLLLACLSTAMSVKKIYLLRHGQTAMNVYLNDHPIGSSGFVDPPLWDTRLTERGAVQAAELSSTVCEYHEASAIELVVSSPLTRALDTATRALGTLTKAVPCVACPEIAERRYLSSDVGRPRTVLADEFPAFGDSLRGIETDH